MSQTSIRPTKVITVPENHLRAVLQAVNLTPDPVAVVGLRGFVKSIEGAQEHANLTGVYDDPISIVTPFDAVTFNGNTDPSRTIKGRAVLQRGVLWLTPGIHGKTRPAAERRLAFIQASGVTIRRYDDKGELGEPLVNQWIGCNLHDGAWTTTGSAACQTVVPERWEEFVRTMLIHLDIAWDDWKKISVEVKKGAPVPESWDTKRFPYVLGV